MLGGGMADDLVRLRARLRITQDELAGRLGVTQAAVSRWESGRRKPRKTVQARIEMLMEDDDGGE